MASKSGNETSKKRHSYDSYQAYVAAERDYLREPTPENWELKEQAFEAFNKALLDQQNSSTC